jgi:hypothetical protein
MHFTKNYQGTKIKANKISYRKASYNFLPKCCSVATNRARRVAFFQKYVLALSFPFSWFLCILQEITMRKKLKPMKFPIENFLPKYASVAANRSQKVEDFFKKMFYCLVSAISLISIHFTKKQEERKIEADKISYKKCSITFLPECKMFYFTCFDLLLRLHFLKHIRPLTSC